jgi:hypothetical protein
VSCLGLSGRIPGPCASGAVAACTSPETASNAPVLTYTGIIIPNTTTSPALAKLCDHLSDWVNADRPGLSELIATTQNRDDGLAVRLTLPPR